MFSFHCEAHTDNGTIDAESLAAQNQRRRQMDSRLVRPQASGTSTGATTPVTELDNLRANAGKGGTFTIFIEVRRSTSPGSVDKILGKTCAPYPEMTTFGGKIMLVLACSLSHFAWNSLETVCDCGYQPPMDSDSLV